MFVPPTMVAVPLDGVETAVMVTVSPSASVANFPTTDAVVESPTATPTPKLAAAGAASQRPFGQTHVRGVQRPAASDGAGGDVGRIF